jgi:hypothetical protein
VLGAGFIFLSLHHLHPTLKTSNAAGDRASAIEWLPLPLTSFVNAAI